MAKNNPQSEKIQFIQQVLLEVSEVANRNFGKVAHISTKAGDNNQVLTETDIEIGGHIVQRIQKAYPDQNIIDEEAGVIDSGSEYTWVVDPIDGTSNYAAGTSNYAIIIGLLYKDHPIAGGIALPFFNEIILAEKGMGAYCNGKQLQVSAETKLLASLVAYCIDGHQENPKITYQECQTLANIILGIRNLRAAGSAVDGILVAKGKYGAYLNRTSKIWDNVGQHIIIEEAGGKYTDFLGNPQDYSDALTNSDKNFTWCIGAPQLHEQLQEIIHKTH